MPMYRDNKFWVNNYFSDIITGTTMSSSDFTRFIFCIMIPVRFITGFLIQLTSTIRSFNMLFCGGKKKKKNIIT